VAEVAGRLDELGVRRGRPVVVLVGGAAGMGEGDVALVDEMLRVGVFPVLDACGAAVVDGGTDSGVMRVVGRARAAVGGRFPLVGVVAEGTVAEPGSAGVEPHHTHLLLVPGRSWGDESPWLVEVAAAIAGAGPSVTLVINGGAITYEDIGRSLNRERPILVVSGTGRAAHAVAAAAAGQRANPRAEWVAASPLTRIVDVTDLDAITEALGSALEW
jgi:hypothetical protein